MIIATTDRLQWVDESGLVRRTVELSSSSLPHTFIYATVHPVLGLIGVRLVDPNTKRPEMAITFGANGSEKRRDIPSLRGPEGPDQLTRYLAGLMPPVLVVPALTFPFPTLKDARDLLTGTMATTLLGAVPLSLLLGWRRKWRLGTQLGWTCFTLVMGVAGVLAVWASLETPSPAEGGSRSVSRDTDIIE
jgi:hypothetical protein